MARSLVLMNESTRTETIKNRLGNIKSGLRANGVVGIKRLKDLFDSSAQHRTLSDVAGIAHDRLLGALLGRLDIGHEMGILKTGVKEVEVVG